MVNTTIKCDNIIIIIIVAPASALDEAGTLKAEAKARTLEAEAKARTLEAEATKCWPRKASRPRPGLEHPWKEPSQRSGQ